MKREALDILRCPACHGRLEAAAGPEATDFDGGELTCGCGQRWPIRNGIPDLVFPRQLKGADARSRGLWDRISRLYTFIYFVTSVIRGVSPGKEQRSLITRLGINPGQTVLEIAAGTGNNLIGIAKEGGEQLSVFGLDLSPRMLHLAARRLRVFPHAPQLVMGNATRIPFADDAFDVVLDGFGIKYYADKSEAIREMLRVVKPGGKIVITELGLPPDKPRTLRQRLLLLWIPGFGEGPPMDAITADVRDRRLTWDRHHTAYVIEFWKPHPNEVVAPSPKAS